MQQRPIKFRAWDEETKTMHVDVALDGNLILARPDRSLILSRSEYPLMQFTGLKDKNGKEIYEGDIIHCEDVMVGGDKLFRTDERKEITFSEGAFCYDGMALINMTTTKHITFEIIGNIYENPELLKQSA